LEAPKQAPQYTSDWEKTQPEIRLEAPKQAPQYTSDWEKTQPEIRLEAPKAAPQYTSDWESNMKKKSQVPLEEAWITPPDVSSDKNSVPSQQNKFRAPLEMQGLTGTSMILEPDKDTINLSDLCVYCLNDFNYYDDKIYKCKECDSLYHEKCLTLQLDHGMCKKCDRMLLW